MQEYIYGENIYTKKELEVLLLKKGFSLAEVEIIINSCEKVEPCSIQEEIKKRERGKDRLKTLQIRVTVEEYFKAHEAARSAKKTLSTYLRYLINKGGEADV